MEPFRFKVVVPSRNATRWLPLCLDSLARQTYRHYDVCVIDDASTDPQCREIIEKYCEREGWQAILHTERIYLLPTMLEGIAAMDPADHDVVIELDGDDWFYDDGVLDYLAAVYRDPNVWMTFGQQVAYSTGKLGPDGKVWSRIRRRRHVRQVGPMFHLRSFKHFLWANVRDESLRDSEGRYFRVASDIASYSPMAEMAGSHVRYLTRPLYVYNDSNPLNNFRVRSKEQLANAAYIREQKRYPKIGVPSR